MEQWKTVEIDGEIWERYEVSTEGRVRSLNYKNTGQIKILKQHDNGTGYLFVNLWNGKNNYFYVQVLVATMFIENPDNKPTVNHINENKHDNRVENLEWATQGEQNVHGTRMERVAKAQGKRVRCVNTGQEFYSLGQAERETGISKQCISYCCKGKTKSCGHGLVFEFVEEE